MRIQLVSALCALSLAALGVQARDTNEVVTADRQDAAIAAARDIGFARYR